MTRTRKIYRAYAIEIRRVGSTYAAAIEPARPELSILGRRVRDGFASEEEALEFAKGRIDAILEG